MNVGRRNAAGFFRWEDAGEPVAVQFHLNAVELLDRDAIRAGETGTAGILLGKRDEGPNSMLVVENYEPVPTAIWKSSDSPFGDRRQLKAMIDRWHSRAHRRMDVLGFYRTGTTEETALTEDDLSVAAENSAQPDSLFLLIEPHVGHSTKGRLFLTKDGAVAWEWSPRPFNRAELSGRGVPLRTEVRPSVARKEPVRIAEEPQEASVPAEEKTQVFESPNPNQRKRQWAMVALIIAVLVALGIFRFRGSVSKAPRAELHIDSSLGLKFERTGTDLQLTWNPSSAAIENAIGGQLLINDGPINKTVNLEPSDLARGTITYSPLTDDVVLRLQVNTPDSSQPVTESVRIVGGLPGLPSTPPSSMAESLTAPTTQEGAHAPGHSIASDEQLQEILSRDSIGATQSNRSKAILAGAAMGAVVRRPSASDHVVHPEARIKLPDETVTVSKAFPSAARRKARQEASAGHSTIASNSRGPAIASKPAEPVSPADPVKAPIETIPVIPAHSTAPAFSSNGTRYTRNGGAVQPALLLTNINPAYPAAAREEGVSGPVELRFRISTTGDVHDITVVRGPQMLAQAAVDAVRQRRYKPARVDGVPTETDASAIFDFKLN
jgi:protein TonB